MPFDPSTFMEQTIDEPLSSQRLLCPEGEHPMTVGEFNFDDKTFRNITRKDGSEAVILRLPFVIQDPKVNEELGRDQVIVYFRDIWLDFKPGTSELDTGKGKNADLGAIRKALGLEGGNVFASMRGAGPVLGMVRHRGIDENDPERKIAEVVRVAPMS